MQQGVNEPEWGGWFFFLRRAPPCGKADVEGAGSEGKSGQQYMDKMDVKWGGAKAVHATRSPTETNAEAGQCAPQQSPSHVASLISFCDMGRTQ